MNEACTQAELGWTLGHFQVLGRVNVNFCVHGPQRGVTRRHQKKALQSFRSLCLQCVFVVSSLCLYCVFILSSLCLYFVFIVSLRLWPLCLDCVLIVSSSCLHCVFAVSLFCLYDSGHCAFIVSSLCLHSVFIVSSLCLRCVFIPLWRSPGFCNGPCAFHTLHPASL